MTVYDPVDEPSEIHEEDRNLNRNHNRANRCHIRSTKIYFWKFEEWRNRNRNNKDEEKLEKSNKQQRMRKY